MLINGGEKRSGLNDGSAGQRGECYLFTYVFNNPINRMDPSGHGELELTPKFAAEAGGKLKYLTETLQTIIDKMKDEKWVPPPTQTGNPNPGAFGTEVENRLFAAAKGRPGIVTNIYFDSDSTKVLSIGERPPGGTAGTTQVDVLIVKEGYTPKVGYAINKDKLIMALDLKASADLDALDSRQVNAYRRVLGTDVEIQALRTPELYKDGMWTVNRRFQTMLRVLQLIGLAEAAYALINVNQYNDELNKLADQIEYTKGRQNPDDKLVAVQKSIEMISHYMSHFTKGTANTQLYLGAASYVAIRDYLNATVSN
jgi:hypothetical protein